MDFKDQLNRIITIKNYPKKIVSVVPSQTELLFDLGLDNCIIGRTKFCIHPEQKVKKIQRIGGTKNLNITLIKGLNPDLIIANKEENSQEQIAELINSFPVWISDIKNLQDALQMIQLLGEVCNKKAESYNLISSINNEFNQIKKSDPIKYIYIIWQEPYMTIGHDTFIHNLLNEINFSNSFSHLTRYKEITEIDIKNSDAEFIFLSSEPFPFNPTHLKQYQEKFPTKKIILVDGELCSWYGSRLLQSANYLISLKQQCLG